MKKSRLKLLSFILALIGNLIVFDGCTSKEKNLENIEVVYDEVDEKEETCNLVDNKESELNNSIDETEELEFLDLGLEEEEKTLYFSKDQYDDVTFDDIFLTLSERGITVNEDHKQLYADLFWNLENYSNELMGDAKYIIDSLEISSLFEEAFLSNIATKVIENHHNLSLYNEENNDIYWEKLFKIVKDNNQAYLNSDEDAWLKEYYLYEEYNDEEIHIVIDYLQDYFNSLIGDYPNFDIKTFACHLSELKLLHFRPNTDRVFETWTNGIISSSKYSDDKYLIIALMKAFLDHEFTHFATTNCEDGRSLNPCILSTGLNLNGKLVTFSWRFLEEAVAHQYAEKLTNETLPFYEINCYILDTLNLVNQLSDENNSILDAAIMQNPIYLIQQFNNPYEFDEQGKTWLYKNLEMLSCYNLLVTNYLVIFDDEVNIESERLIYGLEENANLQLLRLAVSSLSLKQDLSLEDNLFFLKLIEKRIAEQDSYLKTYYKLKNKHSRDYDDYYQDILNAYFCYLEKTYNVENVSKLYDTFDYESYELTQEYGYLMEDLTYVNQDNEYILSIMKPYIE